MHVRLANAEDVDFLFELNESFNGPGLTTKEHIADSIKGNDREIVFVASVDGRVVGFCCVQVYRSMCYSVSYGEIAELFVREEYRRRGVATALVSFAEDYLKARNVASCRVLTGEGNKAAQAFYERLGYKQADEIMYRKTL